MQNIENKQSQIEKIIEEYDNKLKDKNREIEKLNDELNRISTKSYNSGVPNVIYNRGDESDDFSFPHKWALTCKRMESSIYLEPILQFYRGVINSFDYFVEKPKECEDNERVNNAYNFFVNQFKRSGGLKNLIVNVTYNALVYGFCFFTPKLEVVSAKAYGFKGRLDGLRGFKYYDPSSIYRFHFDEDDSDEIKSISIIKSRKEIFNSLYSDDEASIINIDFDLALAGYASYGSIEGDIIGKPFLYSAYSLWQILESMDNSFNRNLKNIGEHSFNFIANTELNDSKRKEAEREIRNFVNNGGGIFISKYGKIEKIESIDANEWYNFRDSMLSALFKNKGVDIKALGLNKGATKSLAELTQDNAVLMASDIVSGIINYINNSFIKRYFDLNFKSLRLSGECDYFRVSHSVIRKSE
ncbi:phage capsid protein [Brachyspira sp. G79]|uniref:phage capsid protein n=1 Tax=Brachyspira sp. G79 TaxID=1358104 RepID=UPI000BBC1739|nr:phage capsid protein [Brachyspira sp. G79]PCG20505.1 Hvp 45 VSH-1 capsid protein [Brachyspira sp. G79]